MTRKLWALLHGWRRGVPQVTGSYLVQADDGEVFSTEFIRGGKFLTMREVIWWRRLPPGPLDV